MSNRKKVGVLLFACVSILTLLTGCGGASDEATSETASSNLLLKSVSSEGEFENAVKTYYRSALKQPNVYQGEVMASTPQNQVESNPATLSDGKASGTNLIEQGVDEADYIKSDGEYLYVVQQGTYEYDACPNEVCAAVMPIEPIEMKTPPLVRVMTLNNGTEPKADEVASITIAEAIFIRGIYLTDDSQLLVVADGKKSQAKEMDYLASTYVASYDVSDRTNLKKTWEFEVEGGLNASRSLNNKLYLIATNNFWIEGIDLYSNDEAVEQNNFALIDAMTMDDVLPKAWLNGKSFSAVKATDCIKPDNLNEKSIFDANLLSILTIPLTSPENMQALCTLEISSQVYASQNAVYLSKSEYQYDPAVKTYTYATVVHKLGLTDKGVEYRASARLPGTTGWRSSDFRVSEKNGYLRVMITDYDQSAPEPDTTLSIEPVQLQKITHYLYILKENEETNVLEKVSALPNAQHPQAIGKPGEDIYAVRYVGDYAYVVTYQKVDPLYSINLKDPTKPFIEGELNMPGFSDYLHPLSDNMLLGVGKETIVKEGAAWMQGVKVGLFDVRDKSQPLLIGEYEIGKRGSDSDVSWDYHAFNILSNSAEGTHKIAIPVSVHERKEDNAFVVQEMEWYSWSRSGLQFFEVDDGSVSATPSMAHTGELISHEYTGEDVFYTGSNPRSVLVRDGHNLSGGDTVHYVSDGKVWSAKWNTPAAVVGPQ